MARYTIETFSVRENFSLPEFKEMIEKYMTCRICIFKIHKILNENSKVLIFINTDLSPDNLLIGLSEIKKQGKISRAVLSSSWIRMTEEVGLSVFSPEELDPIYGTTALQTETSFDYEYGSGQKILAIFGFAWAFLFIYFMISTQQVVAVGFGIVQLVLLIYFVANFPKCVRCTSDEIVFYYYFKSAKRFLWNKMFELTVLMGRGGEYCTIITSGAEKIRFRLMSENSTANKLLRTIVHKAELSYFDEKSFQRPKLVGSV